MLDMHPAVLLWQVADLVMLLHPELRCWGLRDGTDCKVWPQAVFDGPFSVFDIVLMGQPEG